MERYIKQLSVRGGVKESHNHVFIPMVVTTARLKLLKFSAKDVDANSGEVARGKVELSDHKWLIYSYPLPPHLQFQPAEPIPPGAVAAFSRMSIVVVNSGSFDALLAELAKLMD